MARSSRRGGGAPPEVRMTHMSWTDYAARLGADPVVLVPVGALEQHGPHLPLATDALIPAAICEQVARRSGALVAPAFSYGAKSVPRCGGGQHFCGTTSLDAATLIGQVKDVVRGLARHGVKKVAFVNGHMENTWFVTEACDLCQRELTMMGMKPPQLMQVGYWEFLSKATIDKVFGASFPDWSLEHAGIMETSVMLHLHPELVFMDRLTDQPSAKFPVYDLWPYDPAIVPSTGILNTAKGSTAASGRIFCDEFVSSLAGALGDAFGAGPAAAR